MDGQEYLNQISGEVRPVKSNKPKFLSSPFFKLGIVAVVGLILIMILGAVLGGGKEGAKEKNIRLLLKMNSVSEVISEYQTNVKSSDLRSSSASFSGVLANTSRELTEYLTQKYNFSEKQVTEKMQSEIDAGRDELISELFEAKINGILDRIYAHKMAYEISVLMNDMAEIINSTNDKAHEEFLTTAYNSLKTIYEKFNNFSDAR